jgi:hypothetical protein
MITIKINTDNAAFSELSTGTEVARILRELADKVYGQELNYNFWTLVDKNGNKVGKAEVTK